MSSVGFFEGFTDWHSHILPGVDDGVQTLEESLAVLDDYEKAGFYSVWLTPHIMEDIPNKPEKLKEKYEELLQAYQGPVKINLASENMMDTLLDDRLQEGTLLPLSADRLLVETSYFNPPMDLEGTLKKVLSKGFFPVLAHPERYVYMNFKMYEHIKNMGVLFQLNLPSLAGGYGSEVKSRAEKLLKMGCYNLCGTDLHRRSSFQKLQESKLSSSVLKQLESIKG